VSGRYRLTLTVTLLLSCGYFVYSFGVRVVLRAEPPSMDRVQSTADPVDLPVLPADEASRIAREHLADVPWAAESEIQFRDGMRLFYYAQDWTRTEDRRSFEFKPLAMAWFTEGNPEPLVIIADSAIITFESEIDPARPDPGRVIEGQLEGRVTIRGPDNLNLTGQEFIFAEAAGRIWSDNPVSFTWQQHSGRAARGMQIDLDIDDAPVAGTHLAIRSVKEVHLFRDVSMDFRFQQDGRTIPLSVQAAGSFRLRLMGDPDNPASRAVATFEDTVAVRRETGPDTADTLDCDRLDLLLEEQLDGTGTAPTALAADVKGVPSAQEAGLRFRRMRATGYSIVMRSELNQLEALVGQQGKTVSKRIVTSIDYDADQKRIVLNDFDPELMRTQPVSVLPRVRIRQKTAEIDCLQVELIQHDDGSLREIFCTGQGWLSYRRPNDTADGSPGALFAQWKKQLRRYQDRESGQDVIDLSGNAIVRFPGQKSGIAADYIKVWTDPWNQKPQLSGGTDRVASSESTPQPRRVLALDHVTLVSPELHGQMSELQVWFEDAPASTSPGEPGRLRPVSLRVPGPESTDASRNGLPFLPEPGAAPHEPALVVARLTRVRMLRRPDQEQPEVAEVWSDGDVTITHRREPGQTPLVLTADQLHLQNSGETGQIVHLVGQPARLNDPAMNLSGREIFFNRQKNLVWVDGNGTLKLLNVPIDRGFDGQELNSAEDLTIVWNEQMVFDGRTADFVGRVNASLRESIMACQKMTVTMTDRISFQAQTSSAVKPKIDSIHCQYHVEFNSHEMREGAMQEARRARFAEFRLNNTTGQATASGPGIVSIWRRGRGQRAGLAPLAVVGANRGMSTQDTDWEYTRVDFARDMKGNLNELSTRFRGQVQVVYGPVSQPQQTVDLDHLPRSGGAMSCEELVLSQQEGEGGHRFVQLQARQNARLEGQSFFAHADEISFDESKGLYMLRSFGDQESMLSRLQPAGDWTQAVARTFWFIPSRNSVVFDNASRVQGVR